jgi:hypothetical protein
MLIGIAACATNLPKCFPPDTLVQTETGPRPIVQIERGERVWSFDFPHGDWRLCLMEQHHVDRFLHKMDSTPVKSSIHAVQEWL